MTTVATLRKRTGELLHSPLTASPLLDSAGVAVKWFVHVLHVPPVGADGASAPLDSHMPTYRPPPAWMDMSDALGGAGPAPPALLPGSSSALPSGAAMQAPCYRGNPHVELSALSELHGTGPTMAMGGAFAALHDARQSQWQRAMALTGANNLTPDMSARLEASVGRTHTHGGPVVSWGLSTSSPSDDEVAGVERSYSNLSNTSEAERIADALLATDPEENDETPADTSYSSTPRSVQPGQQHRRPAAHDASQALGVRLLTDQLSKGAGGSDSGSSSLSLLDTLQPPCGTTRHATSAPTGATKSDEGSTSEGPDTLLRAAAQPAAMRQDSGVPGSSSSVAGSNGGSRAGGSGGPARVAPFLTKLYTMVDDPQLNEYASWCPGGSALRIVNPTRFADYCLPRFFKHNKLGSFQQQLLTYGFTRIPNDSCLDISSVWMHPHFRQHAPADLEKILRAASSSGKRSASGPPAASACGGEEEDEDTEHELAKMQNHLARLTQSVHGLHEELRSVRSIEMRALDLLVERIHKRFKPPGSVSTDSILTCSTDSLDSASGGSSYSSRSDSAGREGALCLVDKSSPNDVHHSNSSSSLGDSNGESGSTGDAGSGGGSGGGSGSSED